LTPDPVVSWTRTRVQQVVRQASLNRIGGNSEQMQPVEMV